MLAKPSIVTRVVVGKSVGFAIGLLGFGFVSLGFPDLEWGFRWGILLWYTTLGALIGIFGVVDWHPILRVPLRWWMRGLALGGWMNFVLTFFVYDTMAHVLDHMFGAGGPFGSPFWLVLEGAIVGLFIAWIATRLGGEGPETLAR
jgi:hypothetical protein